MAIQYTEEFKVILAKVLTNWRKAYTSNEGTIPTRWRGNFESDEAKELARLRKELRDTQDALDILKKQSAYWEND